MKERDKPNSHISSEPHMVCVSSDNDRHPVTKTDALLLSRKTGRVYEINHKAVVYKQYVAIKYSLVTG
jgi:hypothetical protein